MSESLEHKKRYYARVKYVAEFEKWLKREPKMYRLIAWHQWKKERPVLKGDL